MMGETAKQKIEHSIALFDVTIKIGGHHSKRELILGTILDDYEDYRDGYMDAEDFLDANPCLNDRLPDAQGLVSYALEQLGGQGSNDSQFTPGGVQFDPNDLPLITPPMGRAKTSFIENMSANLPKSYKIETFGP